VIGGRGRQLAHSKSLLHSGDGIGELITCRGPLNSGQKEEGRQISIDLEKPSAAQSEVKERDSRNQNGRKSVKEEGKGLSQGSSASRGRP